MGEIKLVASDLDGTLLRPDETVSERTRDAIAAARRAGLTVVLVTGRPPRSLAPIAAHLGLGGIAICANGAVIWDLDAATVLDTSPLAAEAAAGMVRGLRQAIPGAVFAVELERGFAREAGWADGTLLPAPPDALEADALELVTGPVVKLLLRHPTMPHAEVARRARDTVGEEAVVTWAGTRIVEISAAGVTKAWALRRLCDRLGIHREEVVAVGDMENDLAMLAWAGHAVAVANAQQNVLDAADEVTASNLDDGVAQVLERLVEEQCTTEEELMADRPIATGSPDLARLRRRLDGQVLLPDDDGYHQARQVWNAMVDRRPAVIARCASPADVAAAVGFARERELEIGVRCGGHSVLGVSVPEGGLMVDLTPLRSVRVDPTRRRAWVQGGALLGDLDRAAQAHGLATTSGNVSHTGVGGLTLGGGMGWLARRCGLACDNVARFEVVTADGELLHASESENPDLYWGLRGGGGNFGVVTEFEFDLHQVGTAALIADLTYAPQDAPAALRSWRGRIAEAPRQATLTAWVGVAQDRPMAAVGYVWVGDPDQGRELLAALRAVAPPPLAERVQELSYLELQRIEDVQQRHRLRRYWKGHFLRELDDGAIDAFLARGGNGDDDPALLPYGSFQSYGGAVAEVGDAETAFSHRDALVEFVAVASWTDPAEDRPRMAAARRYAAAVEPFASGVYVNALTDEGQAGIRRAYGADKLARLAALKDRYDPQNVFHLNHNIRPGNARPR